MEFLEATPEEFDDIVALFKKYRFALQERRWYDWKYFSNPVGDARPFKITVGGKIVGAVAVMPQRFTYQGRPLTGVQTVDGLLGMEIRGKGNFNHLMHFLAAQKPPGVQEDCFYLSFPSLAASVKAHQHAGWHRLSNVSMLSCLLTPAPLFKKKPMPALQKGLELPWSAFRRLLCGPSQSKVTIKLADVAPPDFNALIDASKVSGERSADFMKWRVE
ncbi:MAG: GNAT family N-acetyltransferase, partial [Desulfatitalea sp.]